MDGNVKIDVENGQRKQEQTDQQVSGAVQVSMLRQVEGSKVPPQIGQAVTWLKAKKDRANSNVMLPMMVLVIQM